MGVKNPSADPTKDPKMYNPDARNFSCARSEISA
jgi:hypothetical protein